MINEAALKRQHIQKNCKVKRSIFQTDTIKPTDPKNAIHKTAVHPVIIPILNLHKNETQYTYTDGNL